MDKFERRMRIQVDERRNETDIRIVPPGYLDEVFWPFVLCSVLGGALAGLISVVIGKDEGFVLSLSGFLVMLIVVASAISWWFFLGRLSLYIKHLGTLVTIDREADSLRIERSTWGFGATKTESIPLPEVRRIWFESGPGDPRSGR